MKKTHDMRYRAPAALLCLCMLFSMPGGAFLLPTTAYAAEAATPEQAQGTPAPTLRATPAETPASEPETSPAPSPQAEQPTPGPTPESTPPAPPTPAPTSEPTPQATPATPETASASPTPTPATPETAPSTPENAAEDTGKTQSTPETAAYKTAQVPAPAFSLSQKEVYVPAAPADRPGAEFCTTVAEAVEKLPDGGTLWLTDDAETETVSLTGGRSVTIRSYGGQHCTVSKTGSGENMLALSGGAKLTLENVIWDAAGTAGRTAVAKDGAALTLGEGAILQNNTAGGAVFLDGASLTVAGGAIKNNTATGTAGTKVYPAAGNWTADSTRMVYDAELGGRQGLGGAVLMVNGAALTVTAGDISGNTALCGGAVYAWAAGDITLNGGTFSANKAEAGAEAPAAGGALCVDGGGANCVTVDGAMFSHNSAKQGGAVYFGIDAGSVDFTVTAGTFTDNRASADGSILYSVAADGVLDISGRDTVFTGNAAAGNGGIYQGMYPGNTGSERARIYIHDGASFTKNTAAKGACLYATRDGGIKTLLLDGAVFSGNETTGDAGVAQYNVPESTFTVKNCTFADNRSGKRGGCFYAAVDAKGTRFAFENDTFTGNYAQEQGGVWRGFPPESELLFRNCTFDRNTAKTGDGGCFYCPGDGTNTNLTVDGGTYTNNTSGSSGGAFRVNLNGGTVTVKGGALFQYNQADVNAGAFSIRRKGADYYGTAYLLECDVLDNVCNANFDSYTEADLEPTKHYNTGGVYIGENITCHIYDALVTGNYVEKGYSGNTVGSGIGLCPNAQVYLYPEHGATVYGNGGADTMDILAVPYDYPAITHETPARLYISPVTPDGQAYNWTDLNNAEARTGTYDWTNARSGAAAASAAGDGYGGEKDLKPAGFKANIGGARMRTLAAGGAGQYKVRIVNNHTKSALYAGGGVMVNGTVIFGEFSVSVAKTVTVNGATDARENAVKTQQPFRFRFSIVDTGSESGSGSTALKAPEEPVPYVTKNGKNGTVTFTKGTTTLTSGEDGYDGKEGTFDSLSGTFTVIGEDTLTFGEITGESIGIEDDDSGRYFFLLEEIDSGGAAEVNITPPDDAGSGGPEDLVFTFTCENVINCGTLELSKTVTGEAGEKDRLWNFAIELKTETYGTPLNGTFPAELWDGDGKTSFTGEQGGLTFENGVTQVPFDLEGKASAALLDGQTLKIFDLPSGTTYTVSEQEADQYGYATTPEADSGAIPTDSSAEAKFTNDRDTVQYGSLMVFKTVTGRGDKTKDFAFTVEFTPKSLLDGAQVLKNGTLAPELEIKDGKLEFTLTDGENLTVENLPVGTAYTVTEAEADGYTTTVTENDGTDDGEGIIEQERQGQVRFVNDLPATPPPPPSPTPTPGRTPEPTPGPTLTPTPTPKPTLTPAPTPGPGGSPGPGGTPGRVPATGDGAPLLLWTVLLLAALAGLLAVGWMYWKKKH